MCGIAGQVALRDDVDVCPEDVKTMTAALLHRGPDDEGFFLDPHRRVGLGMRRLAIIDLQTGQQPIFNEDGDVACVFNGEIYNFQPLRAELERRGHRFATATDTEVLVHLYEEEGVDALQRLRGMYALALWDARRSILLLARDRVGKKPLYYATVGGRLVFASELAALASLPGLPREVSPRALDLYLAHCYVPSPHSIYEGVRKLPPAHYMLIRQGSVDVRRYWRLPTSPPWTLPREEIVAELTRRLTEAVRLRLVSDVPLGCFLSGGTDSSSVVALMSELSPGPVKTFSIGFTHERFNELGHARTVARAYGTEHHEHVVEPDATSVLPRIAWHFGEPFGDSSALPTWYLSELTRRNVTVALNGDGGDELFGGYPWYRSALALERLRRATPGLVARWLARTDGVLGRRLARLGSRLAMSPGEGFASLRRFQSRDERDGLYTPQVLRALDATAERYLPDLYDGADGDALARMQYTDIMSYLPEELLVKVDRMSMAHSLEARSPLLDHELMEFSIRIPARMKVGWRRGKVILCEAMRHRFPPGFLDRPKMGFSVPVAEWLRADLQEECRRRLRGPLADTGWFRPAALVRLLDEHRDGVSDRSAELWNLLMLAHWVERFPG